MTLRYLDPEVARRSQEHAKLSKERAEQGLCPRCGGEVYTYLMREIPANPNANPVKNPIAVTGGWEYQKNCPCGHEDAAWTKKKER